MIRTPKRRIVMRVRADLPLARALLAARRRQAPMRAANDLVAALIARQKRGENERGQRR